MTIGLQNVDYENTPPEPDQQEEEDYDEAYAIYQDVINGQADIE